MVETRVQPEDLDQGIADTPDAWLAWANDMDRRSRQTEAAERLAATSRRWPDHVPTMERRAIVAVRNKDWQTLREMFPPGKEIPEESTYALPLLFRARIRENDGDHAGAREDIQRALELGPVTGRFEIHAGETLYAIGEHLKAREYWNRAFFGLPPTSSYEDAKAHLSLLLARWEDQHGEPASALRHWQVVLALRPDHAEARRRVDDLSGFRRGPGDGP